jgi:hypothetical protein
MLLHPDWSLFVKLKKNPRFGCLRWIETSNAPRDTLAGRTIGRSIPGGGGLTKARRDLMFRTPAATVNYRGMSGLAQPADQKGRVK